MIFQATICHFLNCLAIPPTDYEEGSSDVTKQMSGLNSPSVVPKVYNSFGASSMLQLSYVNSQAFTNMDSFTNASADHERNHHSFEGNLEMIKCCNSSSSTKSGQVKIFITVVQIFYFSVVIV